MADDQYWTDALSKINSDIEKINQINTLTSALWIGGRDVEFNNLIDEANRVHGALFGFLNRKLVEAEYFKNNPPPNPNLLHRSS